MSTPANWFGGNKGGTPDAPNFSQAAMVNQQGPAGYSTWGTDASGNNVLSSGFGGEMGQNWSDLQGSMGNAINFDPTQARDQAVNQNLDYGMSQLQPMWDQENQALKSGAANSGMTPQALEYAQQSLGRKQGNQYNGMYTSALNAGNETQRTQILQNQQPFWQANLMQGWLPQGDASAPMKGAVAGYDAGLDRSSANNAKKGSTMNGLAGIAGKVFGGGK